MYADKHFSSRLNNLFTKLFVYINKYRQIILKV